MITAQQIKARLETEKDPLQYIDEEVSRCASQMGDHCQIVQDVISTYNNRTDRDEQLDFGKVKEELKNVGDLYGDINAYLKVRKEQVKIQKRAEQVSKALAKRQK
jgi:hypothetical protein